MENEQKETSVENKKLPSPLVPVAGIIILALLGIVLWRVTESPLIAVIFVTVADGLACVPTFRKSYQKPREETISAYVLGALRSFISLPALATFNVTTALYPAFIGVVDLALVIFLIVRRRQLNL